MTIKDRDEWDEWEMCDECKANGDDYYLDENGEMICACADCAYGMNAEDDD